MKKHLFSLLAVVIAATMSLNARTVVIDEGFENGIQDSVWTQEFAAGHTPWAVESAADELMYPSTVFQGTKRAYLRNTTGETQGYITRLVSKVMDLRPTKVYMPELTFWYANPRWGSDRDTLRVLYRTGARAAWKPLAEISTASATWQRVKLPLQEVGQTYQIAFEGTDNLGRGIVLDSIKLQSSPECTVPHNLRTTNKGAGKVNLAWTASYDADYYEVIVCKDTIDPDTIENVLPARVVYHQQVADVTNCDLNLEPGEFYLAYVRSVCDDGEEISAWSSEATADGPFGFFVRTAIQVPFTYTFNYPSSKTTDPDWTWKSNTGNPNPYVNSKTTSAVAKANYSPDSTAALIFSGGSITQPSIFIPADRYVYLATPALADTLNDNFSVNQCQVHFWSTVYTFTGRQYASRLMVGVMTDPEDITTFRAVDTVSVWNNKTFVENIVDLGSYTGKGSYVAFVSDFDRQNLFYIDNVTIEYRKSVNKVTKISVNPRDTYATITWEGNASSYNVLITNAKVNPNNPAAEAIVDQATVTSNRYLCEVLEPDHSWNRPYYVYVKAAGQEWSYHYPFVTIAAQREIPYTFDFEANTTPVYAIAPDNQTLYATGLGIFGNGETYPAVTTSSAKSYAGSGYLYMNKRGGVETWITLPMVENLNEVQVKFHLSGGDTYLQSHATVGIMSNPMDINTFVPVSSFTLNATGYTRCYTNFENYSGPDGVIAILWDDVMNMSQNTINFIDELIVEELSDCVPPTNIDLEIEPDSVTIRWEASSLSEEWELFLSRAALRESDRIHKTLEEIAAMGGVEVAEVLEWNDPSSTPTFGFGGLRTHSSYYLYVRATCDRDWWTEVAFSTPCKDETFPYKETFENYNTGGTLMGCWQLADFMGVGYPTIYQIGTSTSGNKWMELYSSGSIHRTVAILPTVEGNLSDMLLSFDARTYEGTAASKGVIIIGSMEDIRNANSFAPVDTIYVNKGSEYTKVRLDLSQYNLKYDNLAITSGLGNLLMNSHVLIDNVELKDPSCIEAYDFEQMDSNPNSVDLTWKGLSANDEWLVKVLTNNVAISAVKNGTYNQAYNIINDSIVVGQSLHVEKLQPKHTYYVYVRALCGDSIWTTTSVVTSCEFLDPTKPNKETFESYGSGSGALPDCWTAHNADDEASSSYIPYIYSSSTYANSGSNTLRIAQYSSYSPAWVTSPKIKCDSMSILLVSFYMYASSSYMGVFGVMTNPDDLRTFVPIDSVQGTGQSVPYTYDLSEYASIIPPTAKYFAWRGRYNSSDYIYLDDVSFVSNACPMTKPSISELTTNSVRISSGLRTSDRWILLVTSKEVTEENLANEDYVVPASWIVYRDTLSTRSEEIFNLAGQTKYFVATAAICDSVTTSQWSTLSFTTHCSARTPEELGTITFSEDDGFTTGSGGEMPCWTVGSKTQGASSSYIPYIEATSGTMHNGNNYLKLYDYVSTSSSNVGAYAIMPELDVDSIKKYQVNFWGRSYNSTSYNNQVIVGVITDPSDLSTFVAIDTLNLSRNTWDPYSVGFETYESDYMGDLGKSIMFLSDFGATNYAYISEISVELIPTCRPISSFEVDSVGEDAAIISWKGYQDSYRVLVADKALKEADKPTYQYLIDTIVNHSDDVLIENLQPTTNYYIYAQGICDNGDSTAISMVYASVRTTCPTKTGVPLPFFDDFESYELNDEHPGCWQLLYTGSYTSFFAVKTVSSNGSKAIDVYSTSSRGCYMVVPKVEGNLENLKLTFDGRSYGGSSAAKMFVGVMADVNDVTTFQLLETFDLAGQTAFTHCQMELGNYELPFDNLVITAGIPGVTASQHDAYLDNVGLELTASCNSPKLRAISTSFNSAEIGITPANKADSLWQLVIIPDSIHSTLSNVPLYIATAEKTTVDTTRVLFTNLESATSYYIYARTICAEADTSSWTRNPLKVSTQFYYPDAYTFGFEKTELWEYSKYSESDDYYLHPALQTGKDDRGAETQSFLHYPHSRENLETQLYSRNGDGALLMYAQGNYHGGYIIFPEVGEAHDRSFAFKMRSGYLNQDKYPRSSYDAIMEIGTVDKGKDFSTYQTLATIRVDKLNPSTAGKAKNNMLFSNYSLNLDSAMIATKQLVLHMPKQESDTAYLFIDDVALGAPKAFSLVALKNIVAEGTSAQVEWQNIGGPWNLYIKNTYGGVVAQYTNLTGVTSQLVEGLEPQTDYTAVLESVAKGGTYDVTSDKQSFRTLCQALEPSAEGNFVWNFDNAYEWEENDVLGDDQNDSLYFKPACFQTGITYRTPVNGYQWLIQRKGYESYGAMTGYSASRHQEVGRNDSHALRIYTSATNYNSYIILPQLNCSLDTMMIEFYGRCFVNYDETYGTVSNRGKIVDATYLGSAYSQSVVVGTLEDPMNFNTLQIIDTLSYAQTHLTYNDNVNNDPAGLRYWELMQLPLENAQGKYIVLFQPAPGLFFIDDLAVKPVGNTLFAPTNAKTTNITANSATLSWNVRHHDLASVIVVFNASTNEQVFSDTIVGTNYQLSNIQPASMYRWYVYQTDLTRNSPAAKAVTFATECVTVDPNYSCSFETEEGWKNIDGQTAYTQTLCWTYSDAIQNEWKSSSYDPYNQANNDNYRYSYSGDRAVVMRASYSARGTSYQPYIAMPSMDITAYDTLQVTFWIRPAYVSAATGEVATSYTGSTYSKSIIVGTMTDPNNAATFRAIDTVTYDGTLSAANIATEANSFLFQQMKVELAGATGPYVAFMTSFYEKGSKAQKNGDYIWIDNIAFERRQECKEPKDLVTILAGTHHADLTWNGIDSAGYYLLQVSTDPYFADEDAFVFNEEVASNTYRVEGLEPLTTYVWRVQALCGEKWGESSFSQKATFTTVRSPYFYEDFTTSVSANEWTFSKAHADNVVDGTGVITRGLDNTSFIRTTNGYGLEGPHYAATGYSGDYHWLITPTFYLPEEDSVHFSMDLALTACNTAHTATNNAVTNNDMKDDYYFMIIVSDDGGATWKSENILAKWQNTNPQGQQLRDIPANGMNVRYSLAQYAGKNIRIGLYREARTTANTGIVVHVDNVRFAYFDKEVEYMTACQYDDIQIGDITLSGDETQPGIHAYPTCTYASDADAKAGVNDFVHSLEIEVFPISEFEMTDTICEGHPYSDANFHDKDRTGTYRRKLESEHGCDSVITLYLSVIPTRYGEDEVLELCPGETYTWHGTVYNRAGLFRDTTTSSLGCDSIETLVISYRKAEDTIRVKTEIDVEDLPFTYQNDEHPYISGQDPIYYPETTAPGTYIDVVQVEGEACAVTLIHTLVVSDRHQGLDGLNAADDQVRKVLYNDHLYIISNGEWYNASGHKVPDPRQ